MQDIFNISWPLFGLVSARLAGMIFAAPFWNAQVISVRFRFVICLILALAIVPLIGQNRQIEYESLGTYCNLVLAELLTGALFGLSVHIVFRSMMMAGDMIGIPLGLRERSAASESGIHSHFLEAGTPLGRLFDVLAMAVFLLMGGPMLLIDSVVQSTQVQPVGEALESSAVYTWLQVIPISFAIAVRIAIPIVACQLLALLAVGAIGRSLPHVSTFHFGLPLTMAATLVAILFSVGSLTVVFGESLSPLTEHLWDQIPLGSGADPAAGGPWELQPDPGD